MPSWTNPGGTVDSGGETRGGKRAPAKVKPPAPNQATPLELFAQQVCDLAGHGPENLAAILALARENGAK